MTTTRTDAGGSTKTEAFPHEYVEHAVGGTNQRNNICKLKELEDRPPNHRVDEFISMLRYPKLVRAYIQGNDNSISGYKASAKADFFAADFDAYNPAEALEDARATVRRLEAIFGLHPEALRYFFSGRKGFHIEIPEELFGSLEPGKNTAKRMKYMAAELLNESATADTGIYDTTRLWRRPNSKNSQGGFYKVPLSASEFFNLDVEGIKNLAKEPRTRVLFTDPSEFGVVEDLCQLWQKSADQHQEYEQRERLDSAEILNGVHEGERDSTLFRWACSLRGSDIPRDWAERLVLEAAANCTPHFPKAEALQKVANAYETYPPNEPSGTIKLNGSKRRGRGFTGPISAAELMETEFEPTSWIIPDVLPEGVTLLVGKPKRGKSWMALDMCEAIASGGVAFGTKRVEQGDSLYLALEDNRKRLQKRLKKVLDGRTAPKRMQIHVEWPKLADGGAEMLDEWLTEHPEARLVVIDTLTKIRNPARGQNIYQEDYAALETLLPIAAQHGVAIVVVYHLRKAAAADPLDEISSSTGLTAGVDGFLILRRTPGSKGPTLYVDGRDIEEPTEYALHWNINTATWTIEGEAEEVHLSKERADILLTLNRSPEPLTPKEVWEAMGGNRNGIRRLLFSMLHDEQVIKDEKGRYSPAHPTKPTDQPNSGNRANSGNGGNSGNRPTLEDSHGNSSGSGNSSGNRAAPDTYADYVEKPPPVTAVTAVTEDENDPEVEIV